LMSVPLKVYCDTSTLAPNIRDPKSQPELAALEQLRLHRNKCVLLRSRIVQGELERTPDDALREQLKADFDRLEGVLKNEKVIGSYNIDDHYGGSITNPLVQDIQEPEIFEEIYRK